MIVTGINGIVAVVVDKDGFARIATSPDQPTKCVPAGAAAAVTVTSVPVSSPLAVPLFTVNPAIDSEKAVAANAIATKNSLVGLFIIVFCSSGPCCKDQRDAAGYDGIRLLLFDPPNRGLFLIAVPLSDHLAFPHNFFTFAIHYSQNIPLKRPKSGIGLDLLGEFYDLARSWLILR